MFQSCCKYVYTASLSLQFKIAISWLSAMVYINFCTSGLLIDIPHELCAVHRIWHEGIITLEAAKTWFSPQREHLQWRREITLLCFEMWFNNIYIYIYHSHLLLLTNSNLHKEIAAVYKLVYTVLFFCSLSLCQLSWPSYPSHWRGAHRLVCKTSSHGGDRQVCQGDFSAR